MALNPRVPTGTIPPTMSVEGMKQRQATALPRPMNPSPAAAAMLQQQQAVARPVAAGTPRVPVAVGQPRAPVLANPATGNAIVGTPRVPVAVGEPRVPVAVGRPRPVDPLAAVDPVDQQIRQRQMREAAKPILGRPRGLAGNIPIRG